MAYRSNGGGYSEDDRESRSPDDRPDSDLGDKPTYLLEHLATFTVNKESGIVYPSDGMRKLRQLEKTTGIWSQKMQLCLDRQWVLIMDYETGNIIERFPASLIQEPTAFTGNSPMEMYNNILVMIVGSTQGSRSEMHIFQCQSISAVHLVEDLIQLRNGKIITHHRQTLPQSSKGGPPNNSHMYNYNQETDSEIDGINDETSSTSSEKHERDIPVLNHCFDDIEKFIARIQHAAAASRELERRRRNRTSKKKDPGEGMLTLRTKPPLEKEFVDIFAKFKLSFNLLAKLKAHIHDPNAPELVHFLFTPLAVIVDASHDTYYDPHIPARVVNPLLTREAINLLVNCVTSKETELWRSLGEAWTVPREQWKGHVGSYHPVFFDGWSPDYSVIDELDNTSTPTNARRVVPSKHFTGGGGGGDYDYERQSLDKYNPPGSPGFGDFSIRSEISVDSIERNGRVVERNNRGEGASGIGGGVSAASAMVNASGPKASHPDTVHTDDWLEEVIARGGKIVQVTYPRTANNDKELTVVRGEYLEVLDDSRKWWKARNIRNQVGHVPHTIVTPFNETFNNTAYNQNYNKNSHHGEPDRFNSQVPPTTPPSVIPPTAPAEWIRNKHIERNNKPFSSSTTDDYVTSSYSQLPIVMKQDQPTYMAGVAGMAHTPNKKKMSTASMSGAVPPPPPPPPPSASVPVTPISTRPPSRTNTASRKSISSITSGQEEMQEELKHVLTLFRQKRNNNLDIVKTPDIFIEQSAKPDEVERWIKAKGFSNNVLKQLHGINGNDLFALKQDTLEEVFGTTEGKRLASQITIQRNISGYKTARTSELQAILARARKKTEDA